MRKIKNHNKAYFALFAFFAANDILKFSQRLCAFAVKQLSFLVTFTARLLRQLIAQCVPVKPPLVSGNNRANNQRQLGQEIGRIV